MRKNTGSDDTRLAAARKISVDALVAAVSPE